MGAPGDERRRTSGHRLQASGSPASAANPDLTRPFEATQEHRFEATQEHWRAFRRLETQAAAALAAAAAVDNPKSSSMLVQESW